MFGAMSVAYAAIGIAPVAGFLKTLQLKIYIQSAVFVPRHCSLEVGKPLVKN